MSLVVRNVSKLENVRNVLDIGDGNCGYVPSELRKVHFKNVVTIDLQGADYNFDIDGKLFPDDFKGKFDCVVAGEIIEHLVHTDCFLCNVKRSLRKGGYFVLTFPNICCFVNRVRVLFGKYPIYGASVVDDVIHRNDKFHVRDFNVGQMRMILAKNEFEIVRMEGCGFFICGKMMLPGFMIPVGFSNQIVIIARKQ